MTIVDITIGGRESQTLQQRWSHLITVTICIIGMFLGFTLRSRAVNATVIYVDNEAGIRVAYPQNWLIDDAGDYVFRVRDTSRIGYKTSIQVSVRPFSAEATERNFLNTLTAERSTEFEGYGVLRVDDNYQMPDGTLAARMDYYFTDRDLNPALEAVPTVVIAVDILVRRRGQAIILTFRTDSETFDEDLTVFARFLNSVEFQ